jgi:hypothetical protein
MAVSTVSTVDNETWQLISTNTPSAATSSTFTSLSGYKKYWIVWDITPSAGTTMKLTFNGDTSAVYGGIAIYQYTTTDWNLNYIPIWAYSAGALQQIGYTYINDADKSIPKVVDTYGSLVSVGKAIYNSTSAITSMTITPATGTITGTIKLYGIAS